MSEEFKGSIKISDDVIASIASAAAIEVSGIAGMSTGIAGEIYEFIGKKNPAKGVKIVNGDNSVTVDIFIIVDYGVKIHEVAGEVQRKVKSAIEEMTGLDIPAVNVHVQGVKIAKEAKGEEPEVVVTIDEEADEDN